MAGYRSIALLQQLLARPADWRLLSTFIPSDLPAVHLPDRTERRGLTRSHVHPFRQIMVVLDGDHHVLLDDGDYLCPVGTFVFADTAEYHGAAPLRLERSSALYRLNLISGSVTTRIWERTPRGPLDKPGVEDFLLRDGLGQEMERHWTEIRSTGASGPLARARLLYAAGTLILEALDRRSRPQRARGLSHEALVRAIAEHVHQSGGVGVTIAGLASLAGYSPSHFARLFREHTGMSVRQCVQEGRLARAIALSEQGWSQTTIATMLGFSTASAYFHWRAKTRKAERSAMAASESAPDRAGR